MTTSTNVVTITTNILKEAEGYHRTVYWDNPRHPTEGAPTIGYGINLK